jgi:hypothetical protein
VDVETTLHNDDLDEKVLMQIPRGYQDIAESIDKRY